MIGWIYIKEKVDVTISYVNVTVDSLQPIDPEARLADIV